ncbi:hypothetical protein SMICM304S_11622 [Streptomyces microflavus]
MSLTFHWFLPTNGDSRHVVGGGHEHRRSPARAGRRGRRTRGPPQLWPTRT